MKDKSPRILKSTIDVEEPRIPRRGIEKVEYEKRGTATTLGSEKLVIRTTEYGEDIEVPVAPGESLHPNFSLPIKRELKDDEVAHNGVFNSRGGLTHAALSELAERDIDVRDIDTQTIEGQQELLKILGLIKRDRVEEVPAEEEDLEPMTNDELRTWAANQKEAARKVLSELSSDPSPKE